MPSPLSRAGSAADLLPLLDLAEDHFVTTTGRLGRVLACTGLNLGIASAATADQVAAHFAGVLDYLPTGCRVQFVALNRPLRAAAWVPRHLAEYRRHAPSRLHEAVDLLADAYQTALGAGAVPDLHFYAVLTLPGAPAPHRRVAQRARVRRRLLRDRAAWQRALGDLDRADQQLARTLGALGIQAAALGRQGTLDLLWQCANPAWSRHAAAPRAEARPRHPADLRALREQLAQSRLTRRHDYLRLDWGYETTLALRALPEETFPGWLGQLTASGVTFRFALHVEPLAKERERRTLTQALKRRHAVLAERQGKGLPPDIEQEESYSEVAGVLRDMAAGDLRTFRIAVFVTVRAPSVEQLQEAVGAVVYALGDAGGTSVDRCLLWQLPAWQATLPLAENPAGMEYRVVTPNLADTLPFLRHGAGTKGGPLVGFAAPSREAVTLDLLDPGLPNPALVVCGRSGSGKTLFAQAYAFKHVLRGGRVVVLDRSTGHWDALAAAIGDAQVVPVGLDGRCRLNPWQLPDGVREPDHRKLQYLVDLHHLLLGEEGGLDPAAAALVEASCRAVYRANAAPYERDLAAWLAALAADPEQEAGRRQRAALLADRLGPYTGDGLYARLLDGATAVRADALLTIFNFKGLSDRLVPLAMLPLLEYLWTVIADPARPLLLVLDEGWKLLEHPASARFVTEVARTGRHHGLAQLHLSQFPTDYTGGVGQTVLENAAATLLLAQHPHLLDDCQRIFGLTDDERAIVARLGTVKGQAAGAYLRAGEGADSGAVELWVTPTEYWLCTSHPPEVALRAAALRRHSGDVWTAVRELAAMSPAGRATLGALAQPVTAAAAGGV
ncbi:MAG TPA: hypothetical protein VFU72_03220 [Nitrolancea sp.]|nr:hypothetical protein [Nitrolancea sp.]